MSDCGRLGRLRPKSGTAPGCRAHSVSHAITKGLVTGQGDIWRSSSSATWPSIAMSSSSWAILSTLYSPLIKSFALKDSVCSIAVSNWPTVQGFERNVADPGKREPASRWPADITITAVPGHRSMTRCARSTPSSWPGIWISVNTRSRRAVVSSTVIASSTQPQLRTSRSSDSSASQASIRINASSSTTNTLRAITKPRSCSHSAGGYDLWFHATDGWRLGCWQTERSILSHYRRA